MKTTNSESFKIKAKIIDRTLAYVNTRDVGIIVPLKYLTSLWRTLVIPLINCEISLLLIWSVNYLNNNSTGAEIFAIRTLCSSRNSVKSRQYKTTRTIEIKVQANH